MQPSGCSQYHHFRPKLRYDLGGPDKTGDHWPNRSHLSCLELSNQYSRVAERWVRVLFSGIFHNDNFEKNLIYEVHDLYRVSEQNFCRKQQLHLAAPQVENWPILRGFISKSMTPKSIPAHLNQKENVALQTMALPNLLIQEHQKTRKHMYQEKSGM